ncbi:MAG: ABC transporter substrate-binding protein [Chloroflexi bacterium]|nr:ABC transporter substrate-binding protein [Chloroflexota bacterium]
MDSRTRTQGRTRRSLLSLLIALAVLLAGCAVQPVAAPGEQGAAPVAAEATSADSQGFPRTITDGLGSKVTIPQQPQRIVSLTLGTDEILLSLVDTARVRGVTYLAGDSMWTNVSEIARQVENTVQSDPEQIIALEPDLVLAATYNNPDHIKLLRDAGIPVVVVSLFDSVGQVADNIRFVAHLTGDEARAEELIAAMEERLAAIEAQVAKAETKPRVLFYTAFGSSAGKGSTFSDIVQRAGGINLGDEVLDGPFGEISLEKIVELNPDVIITDEFAPEDNAKWQENFSNHPALANVNAKKNGHIYTVPARHLSTLSHYIVEGVFDVAKLLHPDLVQ